MTWSPSRTLLSLWNSTVSPPWVPAPGQGCFPGRVAHPLVPVQWEGTRFWRWCLLGRKEWNPAVVNMWSGKLKISRWLYPCSPRQVSVPRLWSLCCERSTLSKGTSSNHSISLDLIQSDFPFLSPWVRISFHISNEIVCIASAIVTGFLVALGCLGRLSLAPSPLRVQRETGQALKFMLIWNFETAILANYQSVSKEGGSREEKKKVGFSTGMSTQYRLIILNLQIQNLKCSKTFWALTWYYKSKIPHLTSQTHKIIKTIT